MRDVIVIADDLTGAADTGVCFTRAGLSAAIAFSPENSPVVDVLVFTTESRNSGETEARQRIRDLIPALPEAGLIYKKIDSTLRGFPGPELAELMALIGAEKALVAPAFPAQGRTTAAGKQFVNGLPIERTTFHPEVPDSDLTALFRDCGRPMSLISLDTLRSSPAETEKIFNAPGPRMIIGDAETDLDLQTLVDAALRSGMRLFCGSAGLAAALADRFPRKQPVRAASPFHTPGGPVLVVAGSRNPVTAGQVKAAREAHLRVVELDLQGNSAQNPDLERVIAEISPHVFLGRDVILTTSTSIDFPHGPAAVGRQLAQCACSVVSAQSLGGLVITGGEVAMAVLSRLNASGVSLRGEFLSGIPYGTLLGGIRPGLPILTKAGGFGRQDALLKAVQFLNAAAS